MAGGVGTVFNLAIANGAWPSASVTAWLGRYMGANGEFAVQATRSIQDLHPLMFDVNLALRPPPMRWTPELLAGFGGLRQEAKCDNCIAPPSGGLFVPFTPVSAIAEGFHLGGALKTYVHRRWFLQAGLHVYMGPQLEHPVRLAFLLGYTFGKR